MIRPTRLASRIIQPKGYLSSLVRVSEQVRNAVASGKPVVALESTIITHGMPFPRNLETAISVESIIRDSGAIPATIGCIEGQLHVGMTSKEIEILAKSKSAAKISRRDFAVVAARGMTGGTTIAGTMVLAHMAGINVFATGGMGGVHRGGELSMDVSADLEELGRTPVAVVSSGAKAILDLGRTMEYLETKGVTVTTLGPEGVDTPAFYSRQSGLKSPFTSATIEDAAKLIYANRLLNLESGICIFNPIPHEYAIPRDEMEIVITEAVEECRRIGITGKDITPFLLQRVANSTKGRSLEANIALVQNNAKVGAKIAVTLAALENPSSFQPPPTTPPSSPAQATKVKIVKGQVDIMVIGSMAVDLTCTLHNETLDSLQLHTSLPSKMHSSAGGVAHNVALAASYTSSKPVRLIAALGSDPEGAWLREYAGNVGLDVGLVSGEGETARYVAIHDKEGELITAAADMRIIERLKEEELRDQIQNGKPDWIAFDGNLSVSSIKAILEEAGSETKVLFEPTSAPKSTLIFRNPITLFLFPNPSIHIITPNILELEAMHTAAQNSGLFESPQWWSILDSFKISSLVRQDIEILLKGMPELIRKGTVQRAIQLLPYIPNILIKLGERGVLSVRLCDKTTGDPDAEGTLRLRGLNADVCVRHHPGLKHQGIISVTGAGDTFSGVLLSQLSAEKSMDEAIEVAQKAAIETLASSQAVNPSIKQFKV